MSDQIGGGCVISWKWSNIFPSIDTDFLPSLYSDKNTIFQQVRWCLSGDIYNTVAISKSLIFLGILLTLKEAELL